MTSTMASERRRWMREYHRWSVYYLPQVLNLARQIDDDLRNGAEA